MPKAVLFFATEMASKVLQGFWTLKSNQNKKIECDLLEWEVWSGEKHFMSGREGITDLPCGTSGLEVCRAYPLVITSPGGTKGGEGSWAAPRVMASFCNTSCMAERGVNSCVATKPCGTGCHQIRGASPREATSPCCTSCLHPWQSKPLLYVHA